MSTKLLLPLFIAAVLSGTKVNAQEFTLAQAKEFALINHYQALNAELDLKIAKKKIWETTAIGLPQITGGASYRNALDLEFDFPDEALMQPGNEFLALFGADNITQGQLNVSQLLFDGTYIVGLKAAKTYQQLSQDQKEKTANDVKVSVSTAYHLVLVARENLKIVTESYANMEKIADETASFVAQGLLDETELDQLKLSLTRLKNSKLNAERSEKIALAMLKLNMGYEQEKELLLKDSLTGIIVETGIEALLTQDFSSSSNLDLQVLSTQRQLAKLDMQRYKMQRLPSLAAFYSGTATAYQLEFDWYKDATWLTAQNVGISLNIPIFSSGMQGAKIQQARLELEKVDNSIAHFEKAIKIQFNNALNDLTTKIEERANAKKSLVIAQKIYDRTVIKHKEGMASSLELSQIENQLLQAQGSYINAIFAMLNAKVELDKLQNKL